jgi:hypothetical protein
LLVYQHWLAASGRKPAAYDAKSNDLITALTDRELAWDVLDRAFTGLLYIGWFLLPVLIIAQAVLFGRHGKRAKTLLAVACESLIFVCVLRAMYGKAPLLPMADNIIVKEGIGPLGLRDVSILKFGGVPALPAGVWLAITLMGVAGAACLAATLAATVAAGTAGRDFPGARLRARARELVASIQRRFRAQNEDGGSILTLSPTPAPRPSGERAGARGIELENKRPPHPGPLLPLGGEGPQHPQILP